MVARGDQPGVRETRDVTYSVSEAARRLGLTESAVRKRIERRDLLATNSPGGRLRLTVDSVEAERRRLLKRIDLDRADTEIDELRAEIAALRLQVSELDGERIRLKAAYESLLAAHGAIRDSIVQLIGEPVVRP